MNRLLQTLQAPDARCLWLDGIDYSLELLGGEPDPFRVAAAGVAWLRRSQDLLGSDVISIDFLRFARSACTARPALPQAMAEKSRTGFALKTLLADEALRGQLLEWISAAAAALPRTPLCLRLPSPARAVGEAWTLAHGTPPSGAPDEDQIDSASLYFADFLRVFASAGLDAVLLDDAESTAPTDPALCQSLFNVAAGYQWAVGLSLPAGAGPMPAHPGLGFAVAEQPQTMPTLIRVPESFWTDGASPEARQLYVHIPPQAQPETVLARLAELRV